MQSYKGVPSGDGKEVIGIGGFDIENVVVVEESTEQLVDYEAADYLHPHAAAAAAVCVRRKCRIFSENGRERPGKLLVFRRCREK